MKRLGIFISFILFFITQHSSAATTTVVITTTGTSTWTVPSNWNNLSNEVITIGGGGGGVNASNGQGSSGGGGGAFASSSRIILNPYSIITVVVGNGGAAGADGGAGNSGNFTMFNVDGSTEGCAQADVCAAPGGGGTTSSTESATSTGGSVARSVGTTKFKGGEGAPGYGAGDSGGGGGGAGGMWGIGKPGGAGNGIGTGGGAGGGGGAAGGSSATGTPGTSGIGGAGGAGSDNTAGGAAGSTSNGGDGSNGSGGGGSDNSAGAAPNGGNGGAGIGFATSTTFGSGGGGGGGSNTDDGGPGGWYGGGGGGGETGGGAGGQGIIIIQYEPFTPSSPTIVGTTTSYAPDSTGNQSFNHTVPTGGSNKCLIVMVHRNTNGATISVTYDGTSMTQLHTRLGTTLAGQKVFYLANPSTGAKTVSATVSAGYTVYTAFTLQDCAQDITGDGNEGQGNDAGETAFTHNLTPNPAADSFVAHMTVLGDNPSDATGITYGAGQTETSPKFQGPAGWNNTNDFVSSYEKGEDAPALSWTNNNKYDTLAFEIRYLAPAGGAAAPPSQESDFMIFE